MICLQVHGLLFLFPKGYTSHSVSFNFFFFLVLYFVHVELPVFLTQFFCEILFSHFDPTEYLSNNMFLNVCV